MNQLPHKVKGKTGSTGWMRNEEVAIALLVGAALLSLGIAAGPGGSVMDRASADTTGAIEASEPKETEQGTVQFIGLQSKTPDQMLDMLRAMTPEGNFIVQCITTIERRPARS